VADRGPSPAGGFPFFFFFGMMRSWLHPDGRIRSSSSYPSAGGAPSTGRGHIEFLSSGAPKIRSISYRQCGYMFCFSDLRFSSLAIVDALLCWSFGDFFLKRRPLGTYHDDF
jgi:hypothetical protein